MRRTVAALSALLLVAACGPKKYVLLSPEDDYSDDPALGLQIEHVHETQKGRTEVVALVENKGSAPLLLSAADATLLDAKEKTMPLLAKPDDTIEPGQEKTVLWAFDTTAAAKGSLEMKLSLEGKKIWPIIFSTEKPPDFRESPTDPSGPPGGPPGRPPF